MDRLNLLEYRSDSGKVEAVKALADWQKRRSEILKGMESVMGRFPSKDRRVKLEVDVEEEVDMGKFIRQLITYQWNSDHAHLPTCVFPNRYLIKSAARFLRFFV